MDTVTDLREELSKLTWTEMVRVAGITGVPPHTIRHIALGRTLNPRIKTVEPLQEYLRRRAG